jgi:hypothetical protein
MHKKAYFMGLLPITQLHKAFMFCGSFDEIGVNTQKDDNGNRPNTEHIQNSTLSWPELSETSLQESTSST